MQKVSHETVTFARLAKARTCRGAGEWFLGSGIQSPSGGFARYYRSDRGCNAPLSTEVTGYCAGALAALYKEIGDTCLLDASLAAASYLVRAWDAECCAMPFECDSVGRRYSYFFDNGIIVRGLLAVWRECKIPEALSTAVKCALSMARDFMDGENFLPILELPGKSPLDFGDGRWSCRSGCYQLKAALAWYELWQVTQERWYLEFYRHLLHASLASHASFLPGCDAKVPVMDRLHAYLYFLEGLLPALEERTCARTIAGGIARVAGFVNVISPLFLRSDVIAQLLRLRLIADQHGILLLDEKAAQAEAFILQGFRSDDPNPRLNGGFWFGRKNGSLLPFMNPVSTAFCHQALAMWNQKGRKSLHWQSLI